MRPWRWLILSQSNISASTLSWNSGELSDVTIGRILLSFSFEISTTNSDSLFDLMVTGLLSFYFMKLSSNTQGLNVIFFSGTILHLKCVGYY